MDTIQKLAEHFRKFPGIGPRQAKRFVYFLLVQPATVREEISKLILELTRQIRVCNSCYRFFPLGNKAANECSICSDSSRSHETLMVVSRDVDFEQIEKSKAHRGLYFILGGTVPILEKNPELKVRSKELCALIEKRASSGTGAEDKDSLKEVILALNATADGEHTQFYLQGLLEPFAVKYGFRISTLGRGLSSGLELEYSDSETLKSALDNRR